MPGIVSSASNTSPGWSSRGPESYAAWLLTLQEEVVDQPMTALHLIGVHTFNNVFYRYQA